MTFYLTGASAQLDKDGVLVSFECAGAPPTVGTVIWSTFLIGRGDAGPVRQLGWKFLDGRLIAYFVFDHVAARQVNLPGGPQRVGNRWTARFPTSAAGGIQSGDTWRATVETENAGGVGTFQGALL